MSSNPTTLATQTTRPVESLNVKENITFRGFKLALNVTSSTPGATVLKTVDDLCQAIAANDALGERMRLTLGRLLAIVQDRQLFRPQYKRFEEYRMAIAEKYRLSRASVTQALGIARALPSVEPERASKVPLTNLALLAKAARTAREKETEIPGVKVDELLTLAESNSLKAFRQTLEKEKLIPVRKESDTASINIKASPRLVEAWNEFVGDRDPAEVLAELIKYEPAKLDKLKTRRR